MSTRCGFAAKGLDTCLQRVWYYFVYLEQDSHSLASVNLCVMPRSRDFDTGKRLCRIRRGASPSRIAENNSPLLLSALTGGAAAVGVAWWWCCCCRQSQLLVWRVSPQRRPVSMPMENQQGQSAGGGHQGRSARAERGVGTLREPWPASILLYTVLWTQRNELDDIRTHVMSRPVEPTIHHLLCTI